MFFCMHLNFFEKGRVAILSVFLMDRIRHQKKSTQKEDYNQQHI